MLVTAGLREQADDSLADARPTDRFDGDPPKATLRRVADYVTEAGQGGCGAIVALGHGVAYVVSYRVQAGGTGSGSPYHGSSPLSDILTEQAVEVLR